MTGVAALAFAATLTSCSKAGDLYDEGKVNEQNKEAKAEAYQTAFEKEFGPISPNQTWGFGQTAIVGTRAHDVTGNLWYQNWKRPVNVTEEEAAKVLTEFSKVRENVVNDQVLPYNNYWVQQVHQGTAKSIDGTGNAVYPSGVMNQLMAYNFNQDQYEHVNNFNNANNTTEFTDDITKQKFIGTTLMKDMGVGESTKQFAYHNTSSSEYYYDYIVLQIDGAYYVGFDIVGYHPVGQDDNANMDVNRDWIFNDWIVKITPAEEAPYEASYKGQNPFRIIVEDLSVNINPAQTVNPSDWDFNDLVYDIARMGNGNKIVTVYAAGGTLPIYIGDVEVHEKFAQANPTLGITTATMINTGKGPNVAPVTFELIGEGNKWVNMDTEKIPVYVDGPDGTVELIAEKGKAPQKIKVACDYDWCTERQNIKTKYTKFEDYVAHPENYNLTDNKWYK